MRCSRALSLALGVLLVMATAAAAEFQVGDCVEARDPSPSSTFKKGRVVSVAPGAIEVEWADGSGGLTVPEKWLDDRVLVQVCGGDGDGSGSGSAPPAAAPAPASPATASAGSCGRAHEQCANTGDLATDQVCCHNLARACKGLAKLAWSDELAVRAQAWADQLESEGRMYHGKDVGSDMGGWYILAENIARGGSNSVASFGGWAGEEAHYELMFARHGKCDPSIGVDDYYKCGHWANILNKSATRLGCGITAGYLVCQMGN